MVIIVEVGVYTGRGDTVPPTMVDLSGFMGAPATVTVTPVGFGVWLGSGAGLGGLSAMCFDSIP